MCFYDIPELPWKFYENLSTRSRYSEKSESKKEIINKMNRFYILIGNIHSVDLQVNLYFS